MRLVATSDGFMRLLFGLATMSSFHVVSAKVTTFNITSLKDGPGHCPAKQGYECTYRAALEATNKVVGDLGEDVQIVMLPGRHKITYDQLDRLQNLHGEHSKKLTIVGASTGNRTVLDGTNTYQLLIASVGMTINVSNIDFVNGLADGKGDGGANGGAITSDGELSLSNCSFTNNTALAAGGAIQNTGKLTLRKVVFQSNNAGQNGGALVSSGNQAKQVVLDGYDVEFYDNYAPQTGGALLCTQGVATLEKATFKRHATNSTFGYGGTIQNSDLSVMRLKDAIVQDSVAANGGHLANTGTFHATNVEFINGTATQFAGGSVYNDNNGLTTFKGCRFAENVAYSPKQLFPNGATLANVGGTAASAFLQNCTIDAKRAAKTKKTPQQVNAWVSEFFNSAPESVLNLTFVEITNCHTNLIALEDPGSPKHPDHKVIVRGSSICGDGSFDPKKTISDQTKPWVAKCTEPQAPWQCGDRAMCSEFTLVDTDEFESGSGDAPPANVGISCECPTAAGPEGKSTTMWGFPYGGDAFAWPSSGGFAGCFEQWNPSLEDLVGTSCKVAPSFDPREPSTDYACCALRVRGDPTAEVEAKVRAVPGAADHGTVDSPTADSATVSSKHTTVLLSFVGRSFDGNYNRTYDVTAAWIPGDAHCTPGERATCYAQNGTITTCMSNTTFPVDTLNSTAECLADVPGLAMCGYTTFGASCKCPQCKPLASYACACEHGDNAFGTTKCDPTGFSLSACDCATPYPMPAPPPSSPIDGGLSAGAWAAIGTASALAAVAAIAAPIYISRRRARRAAIATLRMQAEQGLLNADAAAYQAMPPPGDAQPSVATGDVARDQ